jgi:dolichol kinase
VHPQRRPLVSVNKSLNGSLAIVAVGVVVGIIGFVVEPLRFLLIFALIITVLGGGIPFYKSLQSK